jgi:hypothetical protein
MGAAMIRLGKPVRLLEWGEGTNTKNQIWETIGQGVLHNKSKYYAGLTTLIVEVEGSVTKRNQKDNHIKVLQPGEGMVPIADNWGEVAMGTLKSIESQNGKTVVKIDIEGAAKMAR